MYYSPRIVTSGLVLALDAAERLSYPRTGTTWRDLSGNNNNGALTNGPTFGAANMGSIVFDGVDDYVNVANTSILNNSSQTINIWFLYTSTPGNGVSVIGKHDAVGSFNGYNMYGYSGNNFAWEFKNASAYAAGVGFTLTANTWWYITMKYTINGTLSVYRNASKISSLSLGSITMTTQPIRIGRSVDTYWSPLPGRVASVQIYSRELSDDEVLQNYNATKSRFGL